MNHIGDDYLFTAERLEFSRERPNIPNLLCNALIHEKSMEYRTLDYNVQAEHRKNELEGIKRYFEVPDHIQTEINTQPELTEEELALLRKAKAKPLPNYLIKHTLSFQKKKRPDPREFNEPQDKKLPLDLNQVQNKLA